MGKPLNILVPDRSQICQRRKDSKKKNELEEEKGQGGFRAWI